MIINGDCLEVMRGMEDNSISCCITDPPYGLKFMGKNWDKGIPGIQYWHELYRICKPGAFLLAFGGTRTFHRLTCSIEDAGWEIRDCIMWLYGQGFPKSHNHFGLEGYGTALKPAWEPIVMAMKPCEGTFKQNAEIWGQAGINIDESRIDYESKEDEKIARSERITLTSRTLYEGGFHSLDRSDRSHIKGRWPANLILDEESSKLLDEQSGIEASRFLYCAKASTSERNQGCEGLPLGIPVGTKRSKPDIGRKDPKSYLRQNFHPTVKPLKLMEYLIKLIMPPKDGVLLDPFAGSGTTILAAKKMGYNAIGIELNEEYCEIANKRIAI